MTCRRSSKEMIFFNIPWLSQTAKSICSPSITKIFHKKNIKHMFFFFRLSLQCQITNEYSLPVMADSRAFASRPNSFPKLRFLTFLPYYLNWKTTNMPSSHQIFLNIFFRAFLDTECNCWDISKNKKEPYKTY